MFDVHAGRLPIWDWLRATRSEPLGAATRSKERRRTYTFALEQAEQMFRAAAAVGPATQPLQLFYGLSQAGRAIAAAASRVPTRDGWQLQGHGIHSVSDTLSGPLPDVELNTDKAGGRGSFVRLSEILDSPLWSRADAVSLNVLWDSLPENRRSPLRDEAESRRTPLFVDQRSLFRDPHPLIAVPVFYFPPWVIEAQDGRLALDTYLAAFPAASGYDSYVQAGFSGDGPPDFQRHDDGWGELMMNWMLPDGGPGSHAERLAYLKTFTRSYDGRQCLFPNVGSSTPGLHPLMVWWAVLYTLSMLARYEPAAWSSHIDVDRSPWAVPLERLLKEATAIVPRLIAEAIYEVAKPS